MPLPIPPGADIPAGFTAASPTAAAGLARVAVTTVQRALIAAGHSGLRVDGLFGPATAAALATFAQAHSLPAVVVPDAVDLRTSQFARHIHIAPELSDALSRVTPLGARIQNVGSDVAQGASEAFVGGAADAATSALALAGGLGAGLLGAYAAWARGRGRRSSKVFRRSRRRR